MKSISLLLILFLLTGVSCKKEKEITSEPSPLVSSLSSFASIGDTIKFTGDNFPTTAGSLEVYFNSQKADIVSQDSKNIAFIVPLLNTDSCYVFLKDNKGKVIKQEPFKLGPVKIVSTVDKVKSGETLTIYGKNFQRLSNIQVTVNDKAVSEVAVSSTGLSFTMPETIYPGRKPAINVVSSTSSKLSTTTTVADKWVRVAYSPFVFRSLFSAFVYNDEGYVLSYDKEGEDKKALFYKLNPHTYKYTTYEVPVNTTGAVATTESIYYITDNQDIFKFGVDSAKEAYVATLPDASNKNNRFVAIGKNIYAFVGAGMPFTTYLSNVFYKFDMSSSTWARMANFPEPTARHTKLTVDSNTLYAIVEYTRFYAYNAENNTWERKSFTINPNTDYVSAFYAQHGRVYALISPSNGSETIYEYNPRANTWNSLGKLREEPSFNFYGFFIGNKHFIGGHKHDPFSTELFESDASYLFPNSSK